MRHRPTLANLVALLCCLLVAGCDAAPRVEIETSSGTHAFEVEIADTPDERARGLMYRDDLAPDEGMLFVHERPRIVTMWMKNTLIPLDMVFIRADGTVARVARNARPMSTETVSSGEPVAYVLEITGGRAAEIGLQPGDRVRLPEGIGR